MLETVILPRQTEEVLAFLKAQELEGDPGAGYTVTLQENGKILACGSLDGNVIKGMAVDPACRGQGLTEQLMTHLRKKAFDRHLRRLFVYTKPKNEILFRGLGFYPLASTKDALLLENTRGGLRNYLKNIPAHEGLCGAAVMNCNPFTLGHRYLVEQALRQCDWLYLFILSEEKGPFTAADRLEMVKKGCADLDRVTITPTEGYLISNATFPTYFLKDQSLGGEISCEMDVNLFAGKFAPALNLKKRFVGTEPLDPVTHAYNETLKEALPAHGIQLCELERLEKDGQAVSASRVRKAMEAGDWAAVEALVPMTTYETLKRIGG